MTLQIGCFAHRLLARRPAGEIVAAFERSAYLDLGIGMVCLGAPGLAEGPLMVPCPKPSTLRTGMRYVPEYADATVWRPPVARGWTMETLESGLGSVTVHTGSNGSFHGLGGFAISKPVEGRLAAVACDPIGQLSRWLEQRFAGKISPGPGKINDLIGLGPGLTPSGDDYLGGTMVAAHALGRPDIAESLFAALDLSRTNRISAAHLAAAREGAASAPLHDLLNGVLCGRAATLPSRLAGLGRMGQSSGWDAFAGCCTALQAYRRSHSSYTMSEVNGASSFAWPPRNDNSMMQAQARTSPPT